MKYFQNENTPLYHILFKVFIMKNKIIKLTFLSLFVLSLSACAPIQTTQQPVHTLSSKGVLFSNVISSKSAKGTIINGNVRKSASASKKIRIAGHIHIILKSKENKVLETIKARTHRKYANSRLWHFDGVLKTSLPVGSVIIVKYH
jgi:hypothetical protein